MTRNHRLRPLRSRRIRALIAGLALVALVLGLSGVRSTMAGWKDSESSEASFAAGAIGPVQNLTCTDSDDGLLPALLKTQVQLDWDRPNVADDVAVEYVVTWNAGALGGSGSLVTSDDHYVYKSGGLLSALKANFTVSAKTVDGEWIASPQRASATVLTLLGVPLIGPVK